MNKCGEKPQSKVWQGSAARSQTAAAPQHLSHHHLVRRQPHGIFTRRTQPQHYGRCVVPGTSRPAMCHGSSRPHEDTRHTRLSKRPGGDGAAFLKLRKVGWGNTRAA